MTKPVSSLYLVKHHDLRDQISVSINKGCQQSANRPRVFFRADDIGIPSRGFQQLVECFKKHRLPLCLATVPSWLNETRIQQLYQLTGANNPQWYWHQHGRVHRNFERAGKKQEFGPERSRDDIETSLVKGRERLEQFLDKDFHRVFTPPWNRCSSDTLQSLAELGFKAVSRSKGARPETPHNLPDFQVNVDLHTRKEVEPQIALTHLLTEIKESLASGLCGIMIHHQRINGLALQVLDTLLELIKNDKQLLPVTFGDLIADFEQQSIK